MTNDELLLNIKKYYKPVDSSICDNLSDRIEAELKYCGIMYRIFSRTKSKESTYEKYKLKAGSYIKKGKGMQDAIGIRIALYFMEDVDICIKVLNDIFTLTELVYDEQDDETFRPQRINAVFSIPDDLTGVDKVIKKCCLVDNTFEVQIRTIFSEGWHEVEHDVRYKYKTDWDDEIKMSRDLNGLFAVLEMCDNNLVGILDNVAYNKYKKKSWEAMIRNRFRIKFGIKPLSDELIRILDDNPEIAKSIFRFSRSKLIDIFHATKLKTSFDNAVFLMNCYEIHNDSIQKLLPDDITKVTNAVKIENDCERTLTYPYRSIVPMQV